MIRNVQPVQRAKAREAEKKLVPAIKVLASSVSKTGPIPNNFIGYKVNAGEMTDNLGRKVQYQVHAVYAKKDFIKINASVPYFSGWQLWLKIKSIAKYVIDYYYK